MQLNSLEPLQVHSFSFSVSSQFPSSLKYLLLFFLPPYSHFHSFSGFHGLRPSTDTELVGLTAVLPSFHRQANLTGSTNAT